MDEIWKDVVGYEGLYQVSNLGNIKSLSWSNTGVEKVLKLRDNERGYLGVCLCKGGKIKQAYVHRIVGHAFIPNPENKPQINHINGIRSDNRVENLEWCTISENHLHSFRKLGRIQAKSLLGKLGKECATSKIVYQYTLDGKLVSSYYGAFEASRLTGVRRDSISKCCNGKAKTAGGFMWRGEKENRRQVSYDSAKSFTVKKA